MFGCLHILIRVSPPLGVSFDHSVSTFWSASDTDFKNLSSNFHWWGVVSTFWPAHDTDFKHLSLGVPAFWSGCLHLLISKWHWLQKPKFGCLHLLIRVSLTLVSSIFSSGCLCLLINKWHWLQKPMFGCLHLLISKWHWLQIPTSGCLHLLIRVFWLCFSPSFHQGVSTFWSASDTDFKNLSLGIYTFWSGCFHLLIRVSLPFDQQVTLTSKTYVLTFTSGGSSPPFVQQVTLTSKT